MTRKPYVVGIVGGSATGKTSFLRDLVARLPAGACAVVSQDNYYRPLHEQQHDANGRPNFDLPTAFFHDRFVQDLHALLAGRPVTLTEYTFNMADRPARSIVVAPAAVLILEGLFLFHDAAVRERIDLRVFLHAADDVCLARRLRRDVCERGYREDEIRYQWEQHALPGYRDHVLPYRDTAHVLVDCTERYDHGLDAVCGRIAERRDSSA